MGRKLLRSGDGEVVVLVFTAAIVTVEGRSGGRGWRRMIRRKMLVRLERRRRDGRLRFLFPAEEGHGEMEGPVRGRKEGD
jgi:hypothetical protein